MKRKTRPRSLVSYKKKPYIYIILKDYHPPTFPELMTTAKNMIANSRKNDHGPATDRPVNKDVSPDRSKFHVLQIACDDTLYSNVYL